MSKFLHVRPFLPLIVFVSGVIGLGITPASAAKLEDKLSLKGVFMLEVGKSGKCIAIAGGAKMGQQFHGWRCRKKSSLQKFTVKAMGKGWYQVRSNRGGMCLDVSGSAKKNGAPIVQWRCKAKNNANQLWKPLPTKKGKGFQLRAKHSGKCLQLDKIKAKVSTFTQRACKKGEATQIMASRQK